MGNLEKENAYIDSMSTLTKDQWSFWATLLRNA
jgi:hypothetical protein